MNNCANASLLVVDDDEIVLKLVERVMRGTGLKVFQASDGRAAAECLDRHQPSLLLVDYWLPDCTGLELIADLSRTRRLNCARVICWSTAELQPNEAHIARKLGVDVMTKDYIRDRDRLTDLVLTSVNLPAAVAR